jgi:general stress protein 26
MKTSKSPSTTRKSPPGRASTATSARGSTTKKSAKATSARSSTTKKSAKAQASVKRIVRSVKRVVKKVAPPKNDLTRVHDLLGKFSTVMLVTTEGEGEKAGLHVRPMDVAKLDDDCTLTFITGLDRAAPYEAKKDMPAHVVAQGRSVYVSLRGRVEVVRDRERIHAAWKPADKAYFPNGKDDPNLCLAVLHPEEVEYWDMTGPKGIRYLFEAARALFSGEPAQPAEGSETHDRIELGDWSARA